MQKLSIEQFKQLAGEGCVIIDARNSEIFCEGFIEGAISIPYGENFIDALNEVTDPEQKIILVADNENIAVLEKWMSTLNTVQFSGFLEGGFDAWKLSENKIDMLIAIEADEFAMDYQFDEFYLVDVRSKEDFAKEHAEDAENIELSDLEQIISEFETGDIFYVYACNNAQAITAGSIFKRIGFERIRSVAADFETIKQTGIPLFIQKKKEKGSSN